jgi:Transglutaminase-like superfamily
MLLAEICPITKLLPFYHQNKKLVFLSKKKQLKAKLEVDEEIQCNVKTGEYFRKYLYFDNTSRITDIVINGMDITPVITDEFPQSSIFHSDSKLAYVDHRFNTKSKDISIFTEKEFDDFKFIDLLKFQLYSYAVSYSEIIIEIPNWLECDLQKFNFEGYNVTTNVEEKSKSKIYTFILQNIPADITLKAVPDFRIYQPHIMLLPKKMTLDDKFIPLLPDINSLYGWYNSLANDIGNDKSTLIPLVEQITKDKSTQLDKIKAIYYYIQNNIKYVAFEHGIMGFKPESCQNVLKNKFGDCKGMANLAKEMLHIIGVDARLTWLGTDGSPYNYDYPSVYVDNHMICTILLDGEYVFLDPTEKHNDLFTYANRIQGREVLIQNGDKYIKSIIPIQDADKHMARYEIDMRVEGTQLKGAGNLLMKGNSKTSYASFIQSSGEKNKEKAIKYFIANNDNNFNATTIQTEIMPNRDEDFLLKYELVANNQILTSGQEKYINLEFERPLGNMVIEDKRNCDYFHGYKHFEQSNIHLQIPPQHTVKYLPSSITETNELGSFHFGYEVKDNKILYSKNIALKTTQIPVKSFDTWKKMIKQLNEFYDDRIILEEAK